MEPRTDVAKTSKVSSEAPTQRPESRLKSRFSIEPLEERVAPDKGGKGGGWSTGGSLTPGSTGFP